MVRHVFRTHGRGGIVLLLVALTGCAGAPARVSSAPQAAASYEATEPGAAPMTGATAAPPAPQTSGGAAQPTRPGVVPLPPRGEAIEELELSIARERTNLAAGLSECRDICSAAGNICVAAREICRLTGDGDGGTAQDLRCRRARDACVDASRRRDGACAVCPAGH